MGRLSNSSALRSPSSEPQKGDSPRRAKTAQTEKIDQQHKSPGRSRKPAVFPPDGPGCRCCGRERRGGHEIFATATKPQRRKTVAMAWTVEMTATWPTSCDDGLLGAGRWQTTVDSSHLHDVTASENRFVQHYFSCYKTSGRPDLATTVGSPRHHLPHYDMLLLIPANYSSTICETISISNPDHRRANKTPHSPPPRPS